MKAEDTVMSLEIVSPKFPDYIPCAVWDVLQAQAEISFKAGIKEGEQRLGLQMERFKQQGRKDVVEWVENHMRETNRTGYYPLPKMWQEQLERWGL